MIGLKSSSFLISIFAVVPFGISTIIFATAMFWVGSVYQRLISWKGEILSSVPFLWVLSFLLLQKKKKKNKIIKNNKIKFSKFETNNNSIKLLIKFGIGIVIMLISFQFVFLFAKNKMRRENVQKKSQIQKWNVKRAIKLQTK